ncbi:MAG: 50S ribosomal protein L18 [Candidatus Latescibacteria bacterium]|nr:50S ribosomal protein L18 [Candidatus Latescibacterota bacterium]
MAQKKTSRALMRASRHRRVRQKINGTPERPRLCVYRSLKHIYAQIIDDTSGATLVASSTTILDVRQQIESGMNKIAQSRLVGKVLGERACQQGILKVAFDRAGYRYHGRVKALAEGVREGGVEF